MHPKLFTCSLGSRRSHHHNKHDLLLFVTLRHGYSSEFLELLVYLKEFLSYYNKIATIFRGGELQFFFSKINAQSAGMIRRVYCYYKSQQGFSYYWSWQYFYYTSRERCTKITKELDGSTLSSLKQNKSKQGKKLIQWVDVIFTSRLLSLLSTCRLIWTCILNKFSFNLYLKLIYRVSALIQGTVRWIIRPLQNTKEETAVSFHLQTDRLQRARNHYLKKKCKDKNASQINFHFLRHSFDF